MNFFKNLFKIDRRTQEQKNIEDWLSNSTDLADLERRQKMLQRGKAPAQVAAFYNSRIW